MEQKFSRGKVNGKKIVGTEKPTTTREKNTLFSEPCLCLWEMDVGGGDEKGEREGEGEIERERERERRER
jgi:hypothetical protein